MQKFSFCYFLFVEMMCPQTNACVAHTGTWAHHLHMNNTFLYSEKTDQQNLSIKSVFAK